ncbi:hypothetical protein [Halioxenophilus sp. WMMB6]|uniref:hypothetical protein n=1 Tax=Halioxenophilus sp. WMMB6 TaxID=3073815 RepID=UPI00295EF77C|nr:hypothetical protein [Halioxenophilus sp. WMMB6]
MGSYIYQAQGSYQRVFSLLVVLLVGIVVSLLLYGRGGGQAKPELSPSASG